MNQATAPKPLTFRQWWDEVGTENAFAVGAKAGYTSVGYMRQLRYRIKRPSYDQALNLIKAANQITPGFVPDLVLMMKPIPPRPPNPNFSAMTKPSKAFLRANSKATA